MRNFILFIRRFFNLILFLGLEIVSIVLIARTKNMMQGNDILSSANAISGYANQRQNDVVIYFGLRRMNDSLLSENERLHAELAKYISTDTLHTRKVTLPFIPDDSTKVIEYASYTFVEARVVGNSVSGTDNYITINRGRADNLRKNMAVISGNGIVGTITNLSEHFATALSILNAKQPVSAKLKRGPASFVSWKEGGSPDEIFMRDINQEVKVKLGDSVVTTDYSTLFPRDFLVGTVFKIEIQKKDNKKILHIRPATNFRNLQYVYVIRDKYVPERRALEDSLKK